MTTQTTEPVVLTADQAEQQAQAFASTESPQAIALRVKAEGLVITTDEQYVQANDEGRVVAEALRKVEAERVKLKAPILEAARRVDALFAKLKESLQTAKDTISRAMQTFERAKERERLRIEKEARERAEAEQRRLDTLALANAQRAEQAGHTEKADEILANVPTVPTPVVAPLTPQVSGSSTRKWWKARLITRQNGKTITPEEAMRMLAKAVADGQATPNLLLLNEVAANKLAGALGESLAIPGIEAYEASNKTFR